MRSLPLLLLLLGAPASAHEAPFNAIWLQPLAPVVIHGAVIPLGLTHGFAPSADLTVELTPYFGGEGHYCLGTTCRQGLIGLIATAGVTLGGHFASTPDWAFGWFAGPKMLGAVAHESGPTGNPDDDLAFVPGTSYELGAGFDFGLEFHRHSFYVALVLGLQYSKAYNYGFSGEGTPSPPSWPIAMIRTGTTSFRGDDWYFLLVPNLNLLRIGYAF